MGAIMNLRETYENYGGYYEEQGEIINNVNGY